MKWHLKGFTPTLHLWCVPSWRSCYGHVLSSGYFIWSVVWNGHYRRASGFFDSTLKDIVTQTWGSWLHSGDAYIPYVSTEDGSLRWIFYLQGPQVSENHASSQSVVNFASLISLQKDLDSYVKWYTLVLHFATFPLLICFGTLKLCDQAFSMANNLSQWFMKAHVVHVTLWSTGWTKGKHKSESIIHSKQNSQLDLSIPIQSGLWHTPRLPRTFARVLKSVQEGVIIADS